MMEYILITGVSSGLGRGLAEAYLERQATVYGCSRRVPEDLVEKGLRHCEIDLAHAAEGSATFRKWIKGVSNWDRVYLNAGRLGEIRDMRDTPLEDLRQTMEINVWANKWLLDVLFEEASQVTQVVGISSGASLSGNRGWNGYSISKAALNMLIKLYAKEQPQTHFVALAPGLVESGMQDYLTSLPSDDRYKPLEILKAAKGTDQMPDGRTCAEKIIRLLPEIRAVESGSYADIRKGW